MITDNTRRSSGYRAQRAAALALALLASACATRVTSGTPYQSSEIANLPRPTRVLVADFQIDPGAVAQDQGIGPRLQRQISGGSAGSARAAIAEEVQSAISDAVVQAMSKAGLPAEHDPGGAGYRPGDLLVTGRVLRIDEGNRTRRMGIGFGAGKSVVEAAAELYGVDFNRRLLLLQTYSGTADSGRKPGLAVGASMAVADSSPAVGLLSGAVNVGGEARHSPVGKEAESFGRRLARDIATLAAERGWIEASAVPGWTR